MTSILNECIYNAMLIFICSDSIPMDISSGDTSSNDYQAPSPNMPNCSHDEIEPRRPWPVPFVLPPLPPLIEEQLRIGNHVFIRKEKSSLRSKLIHFLVDYIMRFTM
jgi:hypothetical protein